MIRRLFTKDRCFYRDFFSMTFILALQNLITCAVNLADNVMLGAYAETSLSGAAVVNQIQFILQMLTMGIGEGMVVLGAQYWGKRELDPIRRIFSIGLKLGLLCGTLLWAIVFFFPVPVLSLFTNDQAVIAEAKDYLQIVCFSYFFFCITNTSICALRGVETVRIGVVVSLVALLVNAGINYLLIFGKFGAPELGIRGAAIGTLIARMVETVVVTIYLIFFDKKLRITFRTLLSFDWQLFRDYIRVGAFVIMSNLIWGIAMAVQSAILGHLDSAGSASSSVIAANSIATTIFQVLTVVTYGASSAAAVLTGRTVGENNIPKVKEYARTMQVLFVIIGVATGLLLFLLKEPILDLYALSDETRSLTSSFINVLCITVIGTSYQCPALTGIVRGGGDTRFVFFNDSIFMWGLVLPLSALAAFVFHWPALAVFWILKSDQIAKCFVAFPKVNRFRWIRQLTR